MSYQVSENEILMTAAAIMLTHQTGALSFAEQRAEAALRARNAAMHDVWARVQSAIGGMIRARDSAPA